MAYTGWRAACDCQSPCVVLKCCGSATGQPHDSNIATEPQISTERFLIQTGGFNTDWFNISRCLQSTTSGKLASLDMFFTEMRVGGLFCELQFLTEFSIRHYPLTGLWFGEEWGKLDESDKGRQRLLHSRIAK